MTITPSAVRDGIKNRLATISGLRVHDTMPDSVAPPAGVVGLLEMTFDLSMQRGLDAADVEVLVIVGRMSERGAQDKLDGYLAGTGATSIKTAIEADQTLGGACQTCHVTRAIPATITVGGTEMLCYRYQLEVIG